MMTIQTPLHAEHQLDQLAGQFAHWRQTRTHPHSPIPPELWAHAVALTAMVQPSRVAKQLRLRLADLNKQIATRQVMGMRQMTQAFDAAPTAVPHPPTSLSFVEVPLPPARPQATPAIHLELHRTDGSRLCIHASETTLSLDALVRAFLEGH
jgi:hypothetical protein